MLLLLSNCSVLLLLFHYLTKPDSARKDNHEETGKHHTTKSAEKTRNNQPRNTKPSNTHSEKWETRRPNGPTMDNQQSNKKERMR